MAADETSNPELCLSPSSSWAVTSAGARALLKARGELLPDDAAESKHRDNAAVGR